MATVVKSRRLNASRVAAEKEKMQEERRLQYVSQALGVKKLGEFNCNCNRLTDITYIAGLCLLECQMARNNKQIELSRICDSFKSLVLSSNQAEISIVFVC